MTKNNLSPAGMLLAVILGLACAFYAPMFGVGLFLVTH